MAKLLRDSIPHNYVAETQLVEGAQKEPGILARVKGVFSAYDTENKNGRVYEKNLWAQQLDREEVQEKIKNRLCLGEADHPETRTESVIKEASHTITEMYDDGKGLIRGEIAVLDVPLGRIVHKMLQAGVKLGFSTRGNGDLIEDDEGGPAHVNPETYEFHGVDFVLNPSFAMCGPDPIAEDTKKEIRTALTESVESGNLHEDIAKDVETLIDKIMDPTLEGEDDLEIVNAKSLKTVLETLQEAHFKVADLEEARAVSETEKADNLLRIATLASKINDSTAVPTEDTTTKDTLVEMQEKHLDVVEKYKKALEDFKALTDSSDELKSEKEQLEAKLVKATQIISDMKECLEKAIADAETVKREADVRVKLETLKAYRKAKTEGIELPGSFEKLLEAAETEDEVDSIMEDLQEDLARRYPDLPLLLNSKGGREEVLRKVMEACDEEMEEEEIKADPVFAKLLDGAFGKETRREKNDG